MSLQYRLITNENFAEAMDQQKRIRVFKDDLMIDDKALIVRFDEKTIVTQTNVGDLMYHSRNACEFFQLKSK